MSYANGLGTFRIFNFREWWRDSRNLNPSKKYAPNGNLACGKVLQHIHAHMQ